MKIRLLTGLSLVSFYLFTVPTIMAEDIILFTQVEHGEAWIGTYMFAAGKPTVIHPNMRTTKEYMVGSKEEGSEIIKRVRKLEKTIKPSQVIDFVSPRNSSALFLEARTGTKEELDLKAQLIESQYDIAHREYSNAKDKFEKIKERRDEFLSFSYK